MQSVGYGDLECSTSTRIFLCFYIVISIVLVAYAIGRFNSVLADQKQLRQRRELLTQMQSLDFIAELNGGQGVRKHEFVLAVLGHLGVVSPEKDIAPWMKVLCVRHNHLLFTTNLPERRSSTPSISTRAGCSPRRCAPAVESAIIVSSPLPV